MKNFFKRLFGSDQDLIKALQRGDQQTWSKAYKEYQAVIIGTLIKKYGATKEEALIAYPETWVFVYQEIYHLDFSDKKAKFSTYLIKTAKNKVFDIRNSQKRLRLQLPYVEPDSPLSDDPDVSLLPAYMRWLADDTNTHLFAELPENCKQLIQETIQKLGKSDCEDILYFRFWNGLKYSEIAEYLGKKEGAVREQFSACKKELKKKLIESGFYEKCF